MERDLSAAVEGTERWLIESMVAKNIAYIISLSVHVSRYLSTHTICAPYSTCGQTETDLL